MDLIVVGTTLETQTSIKRRNNLFACMSKFGIPILFNFGIKQERKDQMTYVMYKIIKNALELFKKSGFEYGIICDDDFQPHDDFLSELQKTVELLPSTWRSLHLCPGYFWGRRFRRCVTAGKFDPEGDVGSLVSHSSGRFFVDCDPSVLYRHFMWLGGPIAVLVNRRTIDEFISEYDRMFAEKPDPNDVLFVRMLNKDDFICREPQLGFENEQGGSTYL